MMFARRASRWWLLALGAVFAAACASVMPFLMNSRDQIRIPHERHAKAEVECVTCHETIFDATTLESQDLPKQKVCLGCHKKEKDDCGFCHTVADKPQTYAARERGVKMNHTEHIERVKEDCTVCHQKLPNPFVTDEIKPSMQSCNNCHEHDVQFAQGDCKSCHKDLNRYARSPVFVFSHQGDFVKRHRLEARSGEQCATCHEQTFCADCHAATVSQPIELQMPERVDRNFIHRSDFEGRHSIEANADGALCQRCHGTSFCQSCHTQRGVGFTSDPFRSPHLPGVNDKASPNFHGTAARRDIVTCAACHDQGAASNCVTCHKSGGVGGNPHPPSWTARHPIEEVSRNAMCQTCHL